MHAFSIRFTKAHCEQLVSRDHGHPPLVPYLCFAMFNCCVLCVLLHSLCHVFCVYQCVSCGLKRRTATNISAPTCHSSEVVGSLGKEMKIIDVKLRMSGLLCGQPRARARARARAKVLWVCVYIATYNTR